jgi:hypothetical protein
MRAGSPPCATETGRWSTSACVNQAHRDGDEAPAGRASRRSTFPNRTRRLVRRREGADLGGVALRLSRAVTVDQTTPPASGSRWRPRSAGRDSCSDHPPATLGVAKRPRRGSSFTSAASGSGNRRIAAPWATEQKRWSPTAGRNHGPRIAVAHYTRGLGSRARSQPHRLLQRPEERRLTNESTRQRHTDRLEPGAHRSRLPVVHRNHGSDPRVGAAVER